MSLSDYSDYLESEHTYTVSSLSPTNRRTSRQMDALLQQEGIQRDGNLDYSAGLFDEDYNMVATGSCFKNTLRCMAVDSAHQGEGLMNQVISHLIDYQYQRGNMSLFLYTKTSKASIFGDLGFYEIARVEGRVVFMENRRTGFADYLKNLQQETELQQMQLVAEAVAAGRDASKLRAPKKVAAVVMNANPFTLGHQYLLETVSSQADLVHVFVVSEDVSLVPFAVRKELVKRGSAHLGNLVYHDTGSYIISNATFPSYFLKDADLVIQSHARLDIAVFVRIAQALGITDRFVGDEPFSQVTSIYNSIMKEELTAAGVNCTIIPRKTEDGSGDQKNAISASKVRKAIHDGNIEAIREVVPASTYEFFTSEEGKAVVEKIQKSNDVIHY